MKSFCRAILLRMCVPVCVGMASLTATSAEQRVLPDSIVNFALSPDRTFCLAAEETTARLLDLKTKKVLLNLGAAKSTDTNHIFFEYVAQSDGHKKLLTGFRGNNRMPGLHERTVQLWDGVTGALLCSFDTPFTLTSLAISADGQRAICGYERMGCLQCWNTISHTLLWTHTFPDPNPSSYHTSLPVVLLAVIFSPDGKRVLASLNTGLFMLDAANGQIVKQFTPTLPPGGASTIIWSIDGKNIFAIGAGTARYWQVSNANALLSLDGRKVVTAGVQSTVCIWDMPTGKLLRRIEKFDIRGIAFINGNKDILAADADGLKQLDDATGIFLEKMNFN